MQGSAIKVVHLTSVHPVFDTRIFFKECKTLSKTGYEVVLIAPHDNDEVREGVRIKAVPRLKGRWRRLTRTMWQVFRKARRENAAIYHFHDSELLIIGVLLKLAGKKVIYDVHEDVPRQILTNPLIPGALHKPLGAIAELLESVGARIFDGIVAATPTIAIRFPASKTVIVQNFPLLVEFDHATGAPYAERDAIAVYVGIISVVRGAREMIRAVELLPETLNASLLLAGKASPQSLENELRAMPGWQSTDFRTWQTREGIANVLAKARLGLVVLHPTANYPDSYPVKLFEYMAMGIPVIASDFPLWREIIHSVGCGVLVDPLDPEAISDAMETLFADADAAGAMGRRGRQAIERRYNWQHEEAKLLQLYARLA